MARFTDRKGRAWAVEITVGDLPRLRKEAGFDLSPAFRGETDLIGLLYDDPERLVRACWVLCESQATAAGVEPEEFGRGFGGAELAAAADAMLEAVADFRHRPAVAAKVKAHLPTAVANMERRMGTLVEEQMTSTSNGSAGNSPGPPAGSTPAP